jgi:hypothetical protein
MEADLHHFDEEQDPGTHQSEKRDPDPVPHHNVSDPQHCIILYRHEENSLRIGSRVCTVYRFASEHFFRDRRNGCLLL